MTVEHAKLIADAIQDAGGFVGICLLIVGAGMFVTYYANRL